MHIKKKEGFILLETMLITSICLLIISMYLKHIIRYIDKSNLYTSKNDLLYMEEQELEFIDKVQDDINSNVELVKNIKDTDSTSQVQYEYICNDMKFKINKNSVFLIESKDNNKTLFRKFKIVPLEDRIIIIPDYYKAYNLTD